MITQQYRQQVQRIAQHEMGHFIASRHFGFSTGDVTVQVDGLTQGHRGGASIDLHVPLRSIAEVDEYLCRRSIILYAGALSEPLRLSAPVKAIGEDEQREAVRVIEDPQSGAHIDHAKIRELRFLLRNIRFPETSPQDTGQIWRELDSLDTELWRRTIAVIDQHYETICGLAQNLTQRLTDFRQEVRITSDEVDQLPAVTAIIPV